MNNESNETYDYIDEHGELLFQVGYAPDGTSRKQRPLSDGKWSQSMSGLSSVLYNLPDVLHEIEEGDGLIFVVETEADADRLSALGLCATCTPGGPHPWRDGYIKHLQGAKKIIILLGNSDAAHSYGAQICEDMERYTTVCVTPLPLESGEAVSDWLDKGHSLDNLMAIVSPKNVDPTSPEESATASIAPAPPTPPVKIVDRHVVRKVADSLAVPTCLDTLSDYIEDIERLNRKDMLKLIGAANQELVLLGDQLSDALQSTTDDTNAGPSQPSVG